MQYIYIHKNTSSSVELNSMKPVENIKTKQNLSYTTGYFKPEKKKNNFNFNNSILYVKKTTNIYIKKHSSHLLSKEQYMLKNIMVSHEKRKNLFYNFLDYVRENGLLDLSFQDFINVVYSDMKNVTFTVDEETNKTVLSDLTINVEYGKDTYYPIIIFNKPLKEISDNIAIYDPRNIVAKYISFDENFSYFKINKFIAKPINVNFIIDNNFLIRYRIKMRFQKK